MSDPTHTFSCKFWATKLVEQSGYTDHQAQAHLYNTFMQDCESHKWSAAKMSNMAKLRPRVQSLQNQPRPTHTQVGT